jgi:ROK family
MPPTDGTDRHVALGVYLRKGRLVGVAVDVHGQIVRHPGGADGLATIARPLEATDRNTVVRSVAELARELLALHPDVVGPVGLGVTLSGLVGPDNREVRRSDRLGWREPVPLAELLETATGFPTMVEHDAKVLALDEQHLGHGRGRRSFAVVTADVGVGSAFVIDHRLWRGGWDEAGMAFGRAGRVLGIGLSWLVNLLNLELVVVRTGPELRATDDYERQARRLGGS